MKSKMPEIMKMCYVLKHDNETDENFKKMCCNLRLSQSVKEKTEIVTVQSLDPSKSPTEESVLFFTKEVQEITRSMLHTIKNLYPDVFNQLRIGFCAYDAIFHPLTAFYKF